MTAHRELTTAVGLCLLGSALVLLAVTRSWISHRVATPAPLPSHAILLLKGTQLVPGARALAIVGLASLAAVPATRRLSRVAVGVILAAAGAGIGVVVGRALANPDAAIRRAGPLVDATVAPGQHLGGWPYVALLGAVLVAAGGLLVVVRGRSWASMSARYDAPVGKPRGETAMWEALDRGEDPTDGVTHTGG